MVCMQDVNSQAALEAAIKQADFTRGRSCGGAPHAHSACVQIEASTAMPVVTCLDTCGRRCCLRWPCGGALCGLGRACLASSRLCISCRRISGVVGAPPPCRIRTPRTPQIWSFEVHVCACDQDTSLNPPPVPSCLAVASCCWGAFVIVHVHVHVVYVSSGEPCVHERDAFHLVHAFWPTRF